MSSLPNMLIVAWLALAALAPGAAAAANPVRRLDITDYRAYLPADHPVHQGMRKFADLVRVKSGGSLIVTVRPDALPGPAGKQIAALRAGAAPAPALMLVASTGLATVTKEFELLDLPYLVRDEKQADALLDGAFGHALLGRLAPTGLLGLAWWENGFRQITTSGAPLRRADDVRGLKMRVIGEPVFVETARALGADPVGLPFGELYEALKSRRVDAQDNFYSQILAGRLHEVQSTLTVTNHSYSALVLVANAATLSTLTTAQRQLVQASAIEAGIFQRRVARDEAQQARARLVAHGLQVNELAPAELQKLQELSQPVRSRTFANHTDDLHKLFRYEMGRVP